MHAAGVQAWCAKIPLAEAVVQVFGFLGDETQLQAIFAKERGRCYEDVIKFPSLVAMVGNVTVLATRLDRLLQSQGSNRWIKAVNKKRRAHAPKPGNRSHGSVYRIIRSAVADAGSWDVESSGLLTPPKPPAIGLPASSNHPRSLSAAEFISSRYPIGS
jgi:hypothetical protein